MNNNLWHIEQMAQHKMSEVDRAVQRARLLREMGGRDAGLLARFLSALRGPLAARKVRLQERQFGEPQVHVRKGDQLA
ncbi:MAG TPA: hypothetical protein VGJ87_12375 [Roseiflexaceae bacterium]|jgi:hypothetical protein